MAWALRKIEKEKPAAGKTDYRRGFWRSGWDSNPRNLAVQLISSQSRYDHFDTAPYLSQHQHLGKRGELMGRTSKNIKLRIPEKSRKIKGFRTGSYRVATTISSQPRYDHFDTSPDIAVPLFRETGGFCGSGRTTGLLYHKTPGYARAKSKKFLFRAKSAAEGVHTWRGRGGGAKALDKSGAL